MSKLMTPVRMTLIIIGIAASLLLAGTTLCHVGSAQLLSSLKQKGSNMLDSKSNMTGNGNMTNSNNTTSSLLKKGSNIISGMASK